MHVADKIGPTLAGLEISSLRSEVSSWCSPASSATTVSQLFDDGSNDGRMASQRRDGELPRWRSRCCSVLRADVLSSSCSVAESMTYLRRSLLIGRRIVSIGALERC